MTANQNKAVVGRVGNYCWNRWFCGICWFYVGNSWTYISKSREVVRRADSSRRIVERTYFAVD